MKKISTALEELISGNAFLHSGLQQRLLNLSQVARFLQPQIEARLKKSVETTAITMNLSRLQRAMGEAPTNRPSEGRILNLSVHSDLTVLSFPRTQIAHQGINKLYVKVRKGNGYITINEGMTEIAVITDSKYSDSIEEIVGEKPLFRHNNVASLAVKFGEGYIETPGFFYFITQQLYFQNINILEIGSAGTELIFYLRGEDVQLAFDTIYNRSQLRHTYS